MITAPKAPVAASPLYGLATPVAFDATYEHVVELDITTSAESPAGPLAAVFAAWGGDDDDESDDVEAHLPLVSFGPLMDEPDER